MAQFTVQLDAANGPVVTVLVGVSLARAEALASAGQQLPPSVPARALVDTGASSTCVDTGILSRLDLRPTGSTSMHTPSTGAAPHVADLYDVSIVVPGAGPHHAPLVIPALAVTDANFAAQGIDALIGRDVLRDCLMVYNGTAGVFTLAF